MLRLNANVFIQRTHNVFCFFFFCFVSLHNDPLMSLQCAPAQEAINSANSTHNTHTRSNIKIGQRTFDITFSFVSFLNDWIVSHDILIYPKKKTTTTTQRAQKKNTNNHTHQSAVTNPRKYPICCWMSARARWRTLFHQFVIIIVHIIIIERDAEFGGCVFISLHRWWTIFDVLSPVFDG